MTLLVHGLSVVRSGRRLLDGVDLRAEAGRLTVVIGPNGAGKTTLLSAVAGAIASTGSVVLDGVDVRGLSSKELAWVRAVVSQYLSCPFGYSVADIVAVGRLAHAGSALAGNDRNAIAAAMSAAGVAALATRAVPTLSGGERQRVALAKALAQLHERVLDGRPHLLLLDEPTANLDPAHQHQILARARWLASRGGTVIATMHDLTLASLYADEVVLLDRGRIVDHGPVDDVLDAREHRAAVQGRGRPRALG